jgi:hypothetical protein
MASLTIWSIGVPHVDRKDSRIGLLAEIALIREALGAC